MMFSDLVNLGSAGAVITTVILFLRHLRYCQAVDREERAQERDKLTYIIVNDLARVAENLVEVRDGLTENTAALRALNGKGA